MLSRRPEASECTSSRSLLSGRRIALACAAAALIAAWGAGSGWLPVLADAPNALISSAVVLSLAGLFVWALLPLQALGRRLPLVTVVALPLAVLLVWLGWIPLANVAKVLAAAALGIWIAFEIEQLSWIVAVAAVSTLVDIMSVAVGPTKAILGQGPVVVGYFTVAITWMGYAFTEGYSGLGVSDVIFFALYLGAAQRFGLRVGWSAVAMVASFLVTLAVALWWRALPALPLLAVAFLCTNADLIWARLRRPGPAV